MAPILRPADDEDWLVFTGKPAPSEWAGWVVEGPHLIEALGGLFRDVTGQWWATCAKAPGVVAGKLVHKAGHLAMQRAREMGVTVHALADPRVGASERWLRRFGFRETGESIAGHKVWTWTP